MESHPSQPAPPAPQLFSVDADGTGAGRIVSESGDVYEGSFLCWQRHGWGLQRWSSGEVYRGTWEQDQQARGVFTDAAGTRWKGDFKTGQVQRVEAAEPAAAAAAGDHRAPEKDDAEMEEQREDEEHKEQQQQAQQQVTHFPVSAYAYEQQPQQQHGDPMARTQTHPFAQTQLQQWDLQSQTQPLPPNSARSHRSSRIARNKGSLSARGRSSPRRRRRLVTESAVEREQREQREKAEELLVAKELKAATYLIANRYGSNRVPFEATFGLDSDSPGPGAYAPSLSQVKRSVPSHSMAPRLPYTSEVALLVKNTPSPGPWGSNILGLSDLPRGDPSRPAAAKVSLPRPSMLPQYVKDSDFFRTPVPGPGAYSPLVSPRGKAATVQASARAGPAFSGALPPPLGGSAIKGRAIPLFTSYGAIARTHFGQGPCPGQYTPRIDGCSTRSSAPAFSMGGRPRTELYAKLRAGALPSPAEYNPSVDGTRADPAAAATVWGRSRSGQRTHPTESIRAIAHPGSERLLRNQLGLASPGPAAYNAAFGGGPARPSAPAVSFGPHIVQPPAVRVARHYVESGHPFVQKFAAQQAKARNGGVTPEQNDAGADGAEDGAEQEEQQES